LSLADRDDTASTMTATPSEVTGVTRLLDRFFLVYCLLVAIATFGYAIYDPFQIDGDAISYMDLGDLIRAHHWAGIVNGYWHPLYPACLALGHILFHSRPGNELGAYYFVNYAIFLLQMVAIVCFTDSIVKLRDTLTPPVEASFLIGRTAMRYLGLALLVIASQRELSLGKIRPDALLQALLLFAVAALLRYLATGFFRYAALMGVALGCAYLSKSFAFVFTLVSVAILVAFCWLIQRKPLARVIAGSLLVLVCFGLIAGPYVAALSRQKHRLNFGDSGSLNYAWYVGGTEKMHLEPWQTDKFGAAVVNLKHPEKQLLDSPPIYSYAALPYGTYPDWFDTTYFNDTIKPKTAIKSEIKRCARNLVLVFRYVLNHPEPVILLALAFLLGAGIRFTWSRGTTPFWLVPGLLGVAIWGIYGTVNIEERYVTVGYLIAGLTLFAMLRGAALRPAVACVLLAFAVLAPAESLRQVAEMRRLESVDRRTPGWVHPETIQTALGLSQLGIHPGDTVACMGWHACLYDYYWARVAGVRILTEVYVPDESADAFLEQLPNREQMFDTLRKQGDKAVIGYFNEARMTGRTPATEGWQQLGESHLYAYPLNLPPGSSTHHDAPGPNPSPIDQY
jgi:hypothetical protein